MHGWIQKLMKSRRSAQCEQETEKSVSKSHSSSSSLSCSSSSSLRATPSNLLQPQPALSSLLRWSRKYDVFVCNSSVHSDIEEAVRLVSFLEASPRSLRCFLMQRDSFPGGAVSTEICEAVQNSHLRALLITPNFLLDDWCKYITHQALAEGPMSNRIIPLLHNLPHSQYPQELRFYFYIDLSRDPDRGYALVNKTVLKYLQVENEKALNCNMDSSSYAPSGEGSPKEDKLMSKYDPAETSLTLKVIEKRDEGESFKDVCCHHQQ